MLLIANQYWTRFEEVNEGVYLIQFEKREDMQRVLREGPWLFSKSIFIMEEIEGVVNRNEADPVSVQTWVQIFGLPPLGLTKKMGRKLGAKIGIVLSVNTKKKASWRGGTSGMEYIRIRAEFDARTPIVRGAVLAQGRGGKRWIPFRMRNFLTFVTATG